MTNLQCFGFVSSDLVESDHWGPWSKCSKTCGDGIQSREKFCNGHLCESIGATCNAFPCNGKCNAKCNI